MTNSLNQHKKRNALGRGLSALLEGANTESATLEPRVLNAVANIFISQIEANPFQPRTEFNEENLSELADSIRVHGVIQPITVRKIGFEKYQIISGERRTRASLLAGLLDIPAYVRVANDQEMLEMAIIENIQREEKEEENVANEGLNETEPEKDENELPPIFTSENVPEVIEAYKREFPGRRIVIVPDTVPCY